MPKTTPWRNDPVIRRRIEAAYALSLEGHSVRAIAEALKKAENGGIDVSYQTVYRDIQRGHALEREALGGTLREMAEVRLIELRHLIHATWQAFRAAPAQSLNKAGYVNALRALYADMSKIQGLNAPEVHALLIAGAGTANGNDADSVTREIAAELDRIAERERSAALALAADDETEGRAPLALARVESTPESISS